jgi:hypothetical protein
MLAREEVEVHLHAFETMTELFQLCEWGNCSLENPHRCSEGNKVWIMGSTSLSNLFLIPLH